MAADNSSVTTTHAATVFIASAPVTSTNMTLTNRYALWVDQGDVRIGGNLFASGSITIDGRAELLGRVGIGTRPDSDAGLSVGPTLTAGAGATARGMNLIPSLTAATDGNADGARFAPEFTEAGGGTHALLAGVRINAALVTNGAAAVTDTASLYVGGAMSATVTGQNYAVWVDADRSRFDGHIQVSVASSTTGSATATLGTNAPIGQTTPFVWLSFVASDGTAVFVPGWR